MRTPKEEREVTAGGYVYTPDGTRNNRFTVTTSDYSYMTKFDRFCEENPDEWKCEEVLYSGGDIVGKRYSFPAKCLSFRSKTVTGKTMTEEQKKAVAERFKAYREARDAKNG